MAAGRAGEVGGQLLGPLEPPRLAERRRRSRRPTTTPRSRPPARDRPGPARPGPGRPARPARPGRGARPAARRRRTAARRLVRRAPAAARRDAVPSSGVAGQQLDLRVEQPELHRQPPPEHQVAGSAGRARSSRPLAAVRVLGADPVLGQVLERRDRQSPGTRPSAAVRRAPPGGRRGPRWSRRGCGAPSRRSSRRGRRTAGHVAALDLGAIPVEAGERLVRAGRRPPGRGR